MFIIQKQPQSTAEFLMSCWTLEELPSWKCQLKWRLIRKRALLDHTGQESVQMSWSFNTKGDSL